MRRDSSLLGAIEGVPASWQRSAGLYLECADELRRSRSCTWEGQAAEAFRAAATKVEKKIEDHAELKVAASRIMAAHFAVLGSAEAAKERAKSEQADASSRLAADVFDFRALSDLVAARQAFAEAERTIKTSADETARRLQALLNQYGLAWGEDWGGPLGWFSRMEPVREDVLDASWDHTQIRQGRQGTCYLIATLVNIMRFDTGDDFLREHVRWNSDKELFEVTLYVDYRPVVVEVDYIYQRGSNHTVDGLLWFDLYKPNVVSIYEAAVGQVIGWDDLVDGGTRQWAIETITGRPAAAQESTFFIDNDDHRQWLRETLRSGGIVTAGGGTSDLTFKNVDVEQPDGRLITKSVTILKSHAYSVERVEIDGSVWVRNPHGPGGGGGGLIHLSREQFVTALPHTTAQPLPQAYHDSSVPHPKGRR
ncbi:MAG: C2 family cysteine protease [Micrococcales bacterium]|nr:C2 family cysteine protease [Micrococcales bacterium]